MIDPDVRPCRFHRGEPADNCPCCRSEQIANHDAEPENQPPAVPARRRPFRMPRQAHIRLVDAREDHR